MSYLATYEVADAAVAKLTTHPDLSGYRITRGDVLPEIPREDTVAGTKGEVWVTATEGEPELVGIGAGVPDYVRPVTLEVLVLASRKRSASQMKTVRAAIEQTLLHVTLAGTHEPLTMAGGWFDRSLEFGDPYEAWGWQLETLYDDARASVGDVWGMPLGVIPHTYTRWD